MPKRPAVHGLDDSLKKEVIRWEQFPARMDDVVPWGQLQWPIKPHCQGDRLKSRRQQM